MLTKKQKKKLLSQDIGGGWLVLKNSANEIIEIQVYCVYLYGDGKMNRVSNQQPLFPINIIDDGRQVPEITITG